MEPGLLHCCASSRRISGYDPQGLKAFAPQVGLEPTTYGLTVRRSNRLSY